MKSDDNVGGERPYKDQGKHPDSKKSILKKLAEYLSKFDKSEKPDFDESPALFGNLIIDDKLKDNTYRLFHDSDLKEVNKQGFRSLGYVFNFENAKSQLVKYISDNPKAYGGILRATTIDGARYTICVKTI